MFTGLFVVAAMSAAHAQEAGCPDPGELVQRSRRALLEARLEDSRAEMSRAEGALVCWGVPSAELLAGLWLTQGAQLYFSGDARGAELSFAAAHRLAPSLWYPELGSELRNVYERASVEEVGVATLLVQGLPEDAEGLLDGQVASFPAEVVAGPHLVQLRREEEVRYARLAMLPPGEAFLIDAGSLDLEGAAVAGASPERRKRWGFLVASGVSAAAAGGGYWLTTRQTDDLELAGTPEALEAALARQRMYAVATYGLAGLAATGVALYVVF